jgi:hypothetical protein
MEFEGSPSIFLVCEEPVEYGGAENIEWTQYHLDGCDNYRHTFNQTLFDMDALEKIMPAWVYRSELSGLNDLHYTLNPKEKLPKVFISEFRHGNKFTYDMESEFTYASLKEFVSSYLKDRADHNLISESSFEPGTQLVHVILHQETFFDKIST